MSQYQKARERFGRAISEHQAAQANKADADKRMADADAELDAANKLLQRFEVDPYYSERVPA
ncbi:MAG TPA: hypothetical protein VHZ03_14175 [Trebonia sp.]|jgi:hypothetical protein|nr:hypothetical protein [Trebonia sp.]